MLPLDVAGRRDLVLLDIRPSSERRSEMGFLPASLALPASSFRPDEPTLAMLGTLDEVRGLVAYCVSGRRSEEARVLLSRQTPLPVFNLEGGLLAWEAEGLPVCRVRQESVEVPASIMDYRRHLLACVVAANAELALDRGTSADPCRLLAECFRRAGVAWDEPTIEGLYRVLDWSAVATFRAGARLREIAANLDRMYASLEALERRSAGEPNGAAPSQYGWLTTVPPTAPPTVQAIRLDWSRTMAIYIRIRLTKDIGDELEYEYGPDRSHPGLLRINKGTGEVSFVAACVPEVSDLGHYRRAEFKLRQHWKQGTLPAETCWTS